MKKNALFLFSFLVPLLLISEKSRASRSMDAPACPLIGKVENISTRKEAGQGISEGQIFTYIDVKLHIVRGSVTNPASQTALGCNLPDDSVQILQMPGHAATVPSLKDCIKGFAHYMADGNFMSGNWLTIEETLPPSECP